MDAGQGSVEGLVNTLDRNMWKGRRVFLTGHTGFKGGWLSLWLARLGAEVRGYALAPKTSPNLFQVARVGEVLQDMRGDICDLSLLSHALLNFKPEIVFHLAAQPLVRASYADPLGTYRTNVMGTANLLEAVRCAPSVRAVVCITTDKVYENPESGEAFAENARLGGYDPYSSSKACAELVTAAYRRSFFSAEAAFCGVATARAGNVIGGGDWSENRLLPDLIRGFEAGQKIVIRRPGSTRPWQHVLEPLRGYLRLADELYRGNTACATAYNFGPDAADGWTVERITRTIAEIWGNGAQWTLQPEGGLHEARDLQLDIAKAKADLDWHPILKLETALPWVVEWYRAHAQGKDMRHTTLEQIESYEGMLLDRAC